MDSMTQRVGNHVLLTLLMAKDEGEVLQILDPSVMQDQVRNRPHTEMLRVELGEGCPRGFYSGGVIAY